MPSRLPRSLSTRCMPEALTFAHCNSDANGPVRVKICRGPPNPYLKSLIQNRPHPPPIPDDGVAGVEEVH